jgi:beta-galactosidase
MEVMWGTAYYPEQWDLPTIESDARLMNEAGIRYVRLMEFAWACIEPEEGCFDFALFDKVIAKFAEFGIKSVLGTPSATYPIWLYEKDPSLIQIHPTGINRIFGTRRGACCNAGTYTQAAYKMVEALADHYGKNSNVVGWQIDNELGHEGSDRCVCEHCKREWHQWLQEKFKKIETLNAVWGTTFWGTQYSRFDQIPQPKSEVASMQNPGLILDYYRFCSVSAVRFAQRQLSIIKNRVAPAQWVTTNLYPPPHGVVTDMAELLRGMDFAGFDYYPIWGNMNEPIPYFFWAYVLSYIRGLSAKPDFAILEQFTRIQGHWCLGATVSSKQANLWTSHAIAYGASKIFYFRWRTAALGQEQLCYGILDNDKKSACYESIKENILTKSADYQRFVGTPFPAEACLLYDKDNMRMLRDQYLTEGLLMEPAPFLRTGYDYELVRSFAPFVIYGINADVKSAREVDLAPYKLVSLQLYQLADKDVVQKLAAWVKQGGHLVLGWRTGVRDSENRAIDTAAPGLFSELAGVEVESFESLNKTKVKVKLGLIPAKGENWAEALRLTTARPLAHYNDKKKPYHKQVCVAVNSYGKGKVYYVGTSLNEIGLFFFYRKVLKDAGLKPKFYGKGIEVIKRQDQDGKEISVILNHNPRAKRVKGRRVDAFDMIVTDG